MDYSIVNIINYLENKDYNKSTIYSDIDLVINNNLSKYKSELTIYLINLIKIYLNNYIYLCSKFLDIITTSKNYFYTELLEHQYMPFSKSRNPLIDKYLIEKLLGVKNLDLDIMITTLISLVDEEKANNYKNMMAITTSIYDNNCIDYNFERGFKSMHEYPSEEKIVDDYFDLIKGKVNREENFIIGDFAELITYKRLLRLYPNEEVFWVSRDFGDGYGYDIAKYNIKNDHMSLYEVKGTRNPNKEFTLTEKETKTFKYGENINETDTHIMSVYLLDTNIKFVDVFKTKEGKVIGKDQYNIDYILRQNRQEAEISGSSRQLKFVLKKK